MATAMLAEACGGRAQARVLAARGTRKIAACSAQTVNDRDASVA
jgi:hypothetical protein